MTVASRETGLLGIARVLFGALVLLRTTPVLAPLQIPYLRATFPLLGWPVSTWHVAAGGLALPGGVVAALCVARTVAVLLFTVGVRSREAGVAAALLGWAVMAQDALAYINTLHLLFLGLMVLGLSGAGSAWALRAEPESDPGSGLWLTRALLVSVYAWSGIAKLNAAWLRGDVLAEQHASEVVAGPLADALLHTRAACTAMAWAIVVTELAIGPLLSWSRTRRGAVVAALAFHAALQVSVHPDFLGFGMAILLLAFVPVPGRAPAALATA